MNTFADTLGPYLASRLGAETRIRWLKRSFPGLSRETWLMKAEVGGREEGLVLRVDPPEGSSFPTSLFQEFEVYRRLYASEIPVAEPLWFDERVDFAEGRPHMLRRLVDGSPVVPGLTDRGEAGDRLRREIAHECIENLARVHLLDWRAHGLGEALPEPCGAEDAFAADFRLWRGYWDDLKRTPEPLIEEALCWMSEVIPTEIPRISLVKGNNGVGEEIFRNNRIVAMSDWEGAALTDGVLDLFWSQGTLELIGFDNAVRHYERCVGHAVSVERMAFARLLIALKTVVCLRGCLYRNVLEGRTSKPFGYSFVIGYSAEVEHQLTGCIGKNLAEVWEMIGPGAKNLYSALGDS